MTDLGLTLREAREKNRLSLRQVEDDTNIRIQYLIALEDGDYNQLPGRVYAIGFLRSYAKYLGLDAVPLVNELKRQWQDDSLESSPNQEQKRTDFSGKPRNTTVRFAGYGLAVAAIAGLVYVSASLPNKDATHRPGKPIHQNDRVGLGQAASSSPSVTPSGSSNTDGITARKNEQSQQPVANPGITKAPEPAPEGQPYSADGVVVTLQVRQDRSWMAVTQDGVRKFEGTLKAGETISFWGKDKVFVHVGNAGAVEVIYNGQKLGPMGDLNAVAKREFVRS